MTTLNITSALMARSAAGSEASDEAKKKAMLVGMMTSSPMMAFVLGKSIGDASATDETDATGTEAKDTDSTDSGSTDSDSTDTGSTDTGDTSGSTSDDGEACSTIDAESMVFQVNEFVRQREISERRVALENALIEAVQGIELDVENEEINESATAWVQGVATALEDPDVRRAISSVFTTRDEPEPASPARQSAATKTKS